MNVNINSRLNFTAYTLTFTHVISQEVKSYTIPTDDPTLFFENIRYCTFTLDLATDDLNYEGQYNLDVTGLGDEDALVYRGMAHLNGTQEEPFFTQYVSPNEDNANDIYITL